ncbi:polysaccharide deacetylase family protein [uncultured Maritimibacter sp.]|jgi:peptidoglycan/xylan/chitin deacetylase (PgdA/CDA1 family)|uniref:polysaccharide deacetylase family protein n=1 Tax=uncultured Maritimibacter sp. TaxID=991866 RepID=UPI002634A745|nr:polysaccharide deacetylase family protein [uncultured Maritimibacter sp.]
MVHEARGLLTVPWSADPEDWADPGSDAITARILPGARPGAIVLSHDIRPGTVAAMPDTLDLIRDRGLAVMPMSRLLGHRDWARLPRRAPGAPLPDTAVQSSY